MKKFTFVFIMLVMMVALFVAMPLSSGLVANAAPETTEAQAEEIESNVMAMKAIAAAAVVGVVGAAGAIGMAIAISKSTESMARQPEIASKINSTMMLGIVFIETAIIYALITAILIIFVL